MTNRPKIGVVLPTGPAQWSGADPGELLDLARLAEDLGFDSLWAGDTLLRPILDTLTVLSAMAAVTDRVTLGSAALLPAFRRPVQAAQAIASVDRLSRGRLTLTVGAGFPHRSEVEYALSDVPWRDRFARLDETVELWRALWRRDTSFHGKVFHYDDIPEQLTPHQDGGPPIWLGGFTPNALRRAGRLYDGWLPYPPDPADYPLGLAEIHRAAAGRTITPALYTTVLITDRPDGESMLDTYCMANYGRPLAQIRQIQMLAAGTADQVAERLAEYPDAEHIVCRFGVLTMAEQREQLTLLARLLDH